MVDPKRLDDSFLDKDGINQQLFPLLKSDLAVKRFTEFDQKVAFKAGGKHSATNIVIAFPGYFEWLAFFDPSPANAPIAAKVAAFRRAVSDTADRITKMLNAIFLSSLSGAALFREISRKPENMLTVRPTYSKSDDSDDDHPDRQTETEGDLAVVSDDDDEDNAANGIGANTTVFVGELMLSPTGVVSKFASSLIAGEPADESLFHELVHAASMLTGTMRDQKTRTARTADTIDSMLTRNQNSSRCRSPIFLGRKRTGRACDSTMIAMSLQVQEFSTPFHTWSHRRVGSSASF